MRLMPVVVGASLGLMFTACSLGSPDGGPATTAAATATATATPAPSVAPSVVTAAESPIDGVWGLKQSKKDVMKHLTDHGFGDRVGEFMEAEQVWDVDQWEWTFEQGKFTARWLMPDRVWKVADYGTFTTDPTTVTLTFAEGDAGSSTTFTYAVKGDSLHLDWQSHNGSQEVKGFPDEAFWRAYLSRPLTRMS